MCDAMINHVIRQHIIEPLFLCRNQKMRGIYVLLLGILLFDLTLQGCTCPEEEGNSMANLRSERACVPAGVLVGWWQRMLWRLGRRGWALPWVKRCCTLGSRLAWQRNVTMPLSGTLRTPSLIYTCGHRLSLLQSLAWFN